MAGGLFNFVNPNTPIGLKGLLAQQFDPKELRYQTGSQALMDFGLGLMNPDPQSPSPWMSGLSRGATAAAQGAKDARDNFYQRGLQNVQLNELQRTYDQRDTDKTAAIKLFNTLPPDVQTSLGGSSYAEQYPADFMKAYTDAMLKSKYDTTGTDPYGANPIWTQDAQGKYHLYQSDKRGGKPHEMDFGGNAPVPGTTYLDTGLGFTPMPTKGTAPATGNGPTVPKNVADVEAEKKRGEAIDNYRSMASKMPGLEQVITQLDDLATKGTYTAAGRALDAGRRELGMDPRESAVARSQYIATIDNQILPLLRNTFGAQFTQVEGETLRATLGDPNKTPQEKQAVLKSFIEQKRRDVEAMALHAAAGTLNPADAAATGGNPSGGPPPGVTAEEWGAMTPEERSHWQN